MKYLKYFENIEVYDIQPHLELFKKLWDEKSGANKWYAEKSHFTIENVYDTDFKGILLSTDSNLLNMWHRDNDNSYRKDGINRNFLNWLNENGYRYYWHDTNNYSWDGILIIPPEYTNFFKTIKNYNL
jgi:hypothetical protein